MGSKCDITAVLNQIPELGLVSLHYGQITFTAPIANLHTSLCGPVLAYLQTYSAVRRLSGDFFLCLYDGWREYSTPFQAPTFVPWHAVDPSRFLGRGSMGEPRFIHLHNDGIFPILPLPVLAFCRHRGDPNVLLLPDWEFLTDRFQRFTRQVDLYDIPWEKKDGRALYWRGSVRNIRESGTANQRNFVTSFEDIRIDAKFASDVPIAEFLRHKFILDLDGMVSAWSGLYWRLWSNSVPVKLASHWEQWYYPLVKNGEHVLLTDRDLLSTHRLLVGDDETARRIAEQGKKLVRRLTHAFALEEYIIA